MPASRQSVKPVNRALALIGEWQPQSFATLKIEHAPCHQDRFRSVRRDAGGGQRTKQRPAQRDGDALRDLPIGVGIVEQAAAEEQQQQIRRGKRPGQAQPPTLRGLFGVRIGHATAPGATGGPPRRQ